MKRKRQDGESNFNKKVTCFFWWEVAVKLVELRESWLDTTVMNKINFDTKFGYLGGGHFSCRYFTIFLKKLESDSMF